MSEPLDTTGTSSTQLPCSTIVYRVLRSQWIDADNGEVQDRAFERRMSKNGLSVSCSLEHALGALKKPKAVVTLHVGRIRDLGLKVEPKAEDPLGAEITGVPLESEDREKASRLQRLLVGQTKGRFVWPHQPDPTS